MRKIYYWHGLCGNLKPFQPYKAEIQRLLAGDYKALHLEKLKTQKKYPIYCIRGIEERTTRLLFTAINGKVCLLEVVKNHDYHRSYVLRQGKISIEILENATEVENIDDLIEDEDEKDVLAEPVPLNLEFYQDNLICFNSEQNTAISAKLPAIVYGPAGSGKTLVALSMLSNHVRRRQRERHQEEQEPLPVVYVSQSPRLVEEVRRSWESSVAGDEPVATVYFKTYDEVLKDELPAGMQCLPHDAASFSQWCSGGESKTSIAKALPKLSAEEVWQEFRIRSGHSSEGYINLGVRQSVLTQEERPIIDHWYNKYVDHLTSSNTISPELYSFGGRARYSLLVVDEGQDLSYIQQYNLFRLALNGNVAFFLGDHQMLHDVIPANSYLKSKLSFFVTGAPISEIQLPGTYRCSTKVITLANRLVSLKYRATGGAANKFESPHLVSAYEATSSVVGECSFFGLDDKASLSVLKEQARWPNVAVITTSEYVDGAKQALGTELVFTPEMVKGLEYDTIVVWRPLDTDGCKAACKKLKVAPEEPGKHRAKKNQADVSFGTYFDELITAVTRAKSRVVVVQDPRHEIAPMYNKLNPESGEPKHTAEPVQTDLLHRAFPEQKKTPAPDDEQEAKLKADWEKQVVTLLGLGYEKQAFEIYTGQELRHTKEEFKALQITLKQQEIASSSGSKSVSLNARPDPDAEAQRNKGDTARASASKIPTKTPNKKIQEAVDVLVKEFNPHRLKVLLKLYTIDEILLCTLAQDDSKMQRRTLLDYILLDYERITVLHESVLGNFDIFNKLQKSDAWRLIMEQPKSGPNYDLLEDLISIAKGIPNTANFQACISALPIDVQATMSVMHAAAWGNKPDVIKSLLKHVNLGINQINTPINKGGETPVYLAADRGHADVIEVLCKHNAELDTPRELDKVTPLLIAVYRGHVKAVEVLCQYGANPNIRNIRGETPVFQAATMGKDGAKLIQILCKYLAQPNTPRDDGVTPVWIAASLGHTNNVIALHNCGATFNSPDGFRGGTPLFVAASKGHSSVVNYFIANNLPIEKCYFSATDLMSTYSRALSQISLKINARLKAGDSEEAIALLPSDIASVMGYKKIAKDIKAHTLARARNTIPSPVFFASARPAPKTASGKNPELPPPR